jgi:hypothetical protein
MFQKKFLVLLSGEVLYPHSFLFLVLQQETFWNTSWYNSVIAWGRGAKYCDVKRSTFIFNSMAQDDQKLHKNVHVAE